MIILKHLSRFVLFVWLLYYTTPLAAQTILKNTYFKVTIDEKGFVTKMENGKRDFSIAQKPSPLLCLYDADARKYFLPISCQLNAQKKFQIQFENGSEAVVNVETKRKKYFKFTLQSLTQRENIDAVEWGPYYTNINNLFGEILGVARDTSSAVNFAIGVLALNDATTGGAATTVDDIPPFNYIIHSPDKNKIPLPASVHEGQYFNLGGDGTNDVTFYSHIEPYFRMVMGNSAMVDSTGNITIRYHATDRSKPRMVDLSLRPGFDKQKPSHQELLPLPGVDYIGSSIALWGGPDDIALMEIIQPIVLQEKLPHPMVNKRWVKDPINYRPDVAWYGDYDSAISYTSQLGFKAIQAEGLGEFYPNRANKGNIDLKLPFSTDNKSIKEFTDQSKDKRILLGLHTMTNFLQKGCSDVSPVPNDSLCYLLQRKIVNAISDTDTTIIVDDGKYLDEIAGWAGHPKEANIIKIGEELIHYLGVTSSPPFTLTNVKRGYWGTTASGHEAGDQALKLMTNCYGGLVPDMNLQEKIATYYAQLAAVTGMRYIDLDGEEGLFYQGHGIYAAKLFFRRLFNEGKKLGVPYIRIMGTTLSEGAWHCQSVYNIGGGKNMYDIKNRKWAIEGKDIRDVCVSNYFPATFGLNFNLTPTSTVQEYENIQALSVGVGVTYMLALSQNEVEACPKKFEIFKAIRTWENARAANVFSAAIKKELANTDMYFHLEEKDKHTWNLYKVDKDGGNKVLYKVLGRNGKFSSAPLIAGLASVATLNLIKPIFKSAKPSFPQYTLPNFIPPLLKTKYFSVTIDEKGFITKMENGKRDFALAQRPSPLLCLYDADAHKYFLPTSCQYDAKNTLQIKFENGSEAVVYVETKSEKYFKFTLQSLTRRENVDAIEWGPYYTNINNIFGELIGVARDTSSAVNFAIGALALNDATTGGAATTIGDIAPMNYIIHSPDKKKIPLPASLHEGQYFSIGGDGTNDVAFYSHPELYYRMMYGNSAIVDSTGNIIIRYHATDRRKSRMIYFSLFTGWKIHAPSHQELLPLPGVDYIGSSIALWGGPDDIALMEIIQSIVLQENLPYPTVNKKWVKDPINYRPDVAWYGDYDSAISYMSQLGFKAIQAEGVNGGFFPNRANKGNIDLKLPFSTGEKSIKEFTDQSNAKGILLGLHTMNNFLQRECSDVSPVPSDSLCYLLQRKIVNTISATERTIVVNDGKYLDEIAGWPERVLGDNIIKIGKELIHYSGVTSSPPFTLTDVERGYWGTKASAHQAGDQMLKLINNVYHGLVPNMLLQEKVAIYYAQLAAVNGMHYIDLDGQEGLFYQGHGNYAVKLYFRKLFEEGKKLGVPYIRVMGATLSEGAWHYQSVFNIGGSGHMFDITNKSWGIEGKDIRDVCVGNYFPATFGMDFGFESNSTVQQYENIQALSVGVGVTYMLDLSPARVEGCPKKYEIFKAIRTWENARAANAFPLAVKKELAKLNLYFHLEEKDKNTWNLYKVNKDGRHKVLYKELRAM